MARRTRTGRGSAAVGLEEIDVTERELEVFRLLKKKVKTKEVALRLVISVATVYTHVRNVCRKLGVSGRGEALALLWEWGLLAPRKNT